MRARWAVALTAVLTAVVVAAGGAAWATDPVAARLRATSSTRSTCSTASEEAQAEERLAAAALRDGPRPLGRLRRRVHESVGCRDLGQHDRRCERPRAEPVSARRRRPRAASMYLSADSEGPVTPEQLAEIEQEQIQPALADDDWLGRRRRGRRRPDRSRGRRLGRRAGRRQRRRIPDGRSSCSSPIAAGIGLVVVLVIRSRRRKPGVGPRGRRPGGRADRHEGARAPSGIRPRPDR